MKMNIFKVVMEVIAIIVALVNIVERPGDGAQKKKEVVDLFIAKAGELLTLPKWASDLFLRPTFVGWLVDIVVWAANTFGFFERSSGDDSASGPSQSGASTASA